ncbi:uncharacterized protein DUF3300 [Paraburkholderia sp. BL23I1N1]|uniref:DUF3300 domain-containing protein n=1 Tax=Paraburkholderia sp. BL23I1N1 TaxID=1938802 RepID=UPI000E715902|nr:DUF3300 domain-containing protein [Paraburkholderia sp. BL23I1N1]RKE35201.1 uncharacterized protein DUF3300 [Paraburkholderia sp. BL23I1N1]
MKRSGTHRSRVLLVCAALAGAPLFVGLATPSAAYAQSAAKISNQQLDSLTAPIALYPDALLAQVLMAATFPQDVQAAAAWSKANSKLQGDDAVKAVASETWDPSVQSLVAFPQVLATMASKPDWVTQLGNAFLAQPNDVMDSVQRLRKQAQAAGNLKTSSQQKVVVEQSTIQIVPANPQVVYVPTYNPTVVYGTWPYPAYPPVYVPPPPGYAIATGLATGLAFGASIAVANSLWGGFNWNTHDVNINVNRYNNINVNNRLNVNSSTTNWNRNTNVNRNVNNTTINRNANNNLGGAQRDAYRGRDDNARAQAQQTLQNRTGQNLSGSASQRVQGIHQGGTANADLQNRAQNANRDNALRGAGDGNAARQDTQRGEASRNAAANRSNRSSSSGLGANGGGQQRSGGGLGANGGGVQRGGGGGGGRLGGGGGGERHLGRNR